MTGIRIPFAAQDDEQVGHHGRLALLVQLHHMLLVKPVEDKLDHTNRAIHNALARGCARAT